MSSEITLLFSLVITLITGVTDAFMLGVYMMFEITLSFRLVITNDHRSSKHLHDGIICVI